MTPDEIKAARESAGRLSLAVEWLELGHQVEWRPEGAACWLPFTGIPSRLDGVEYRIAAPVGDATRQSWRAGWNTAVYAALLKVPGGDVCDPQTVADEIRKLLLPDGAPEVAGDLAPFSGA